jgi:ribonuclease T1
VALRPQVNRRRLLAAAAAVLVVVVGVFLFLRPGPPSAPAAPAAAGCAVVAHQVPGAASGLPVRPLCALPPEAAQVWKQIASGGKLRYDRDGITFVNKERILPQRPGGFYREYTVPTPGEGDRGARRLITGGDRGPAQELYYTGDHYASFVVVDAAS